MDGIDPVLLERRLTLLEGITKANATHHIETKEMLTKYFDEERKQHGELYDAIDNLRKFVQDLSKSVYYHRGYLRAGMKFIGWIGAIAGVLLGVMNWGRISEWVRKLISIS